ncbi:52 kDa repressor of the inhibitor of the protein kinase-like [Rhopalosiphum maidis]|uniref:52 kDa repressor of the inhibitor of the protein kinase-like n=1 Tax=Rhopalosiphum maidis TaxID=43146 RepID=UPI000EFE3926|nr:52 kDa repressor of the inhibitor of the protein kinase-like [Rhopalosiphum maidis]
MDNKIVEKNCNNPTISVVDVLTPCNAQVTSTNSNTCVSTMIDPDISEVVSTPCVSNDTNIIIYNSSDVGDFINIHPIPEDKKYSLLTNPYKPTINYNFKNDMASNSKRAFNLKYLEMYDWMIYSPKHKGVFCKFCVLFKANVHRGKQGSFIITPFTKFYQIIEESKKHEKTQWHNDSKVTAKLFLDSDNILSNHFDTASGKSKYISHRIQNEIIQICGQVIRNDIVSQVNNSVAFSLLADETADIAGKEQLSIGVRYIDINYVVHEEFIGFSEIHILNAEGVSRSILESTEKYGLNMLKFVGLGFDGCSTMSGKENGVQAIIRKIYPTACYFHCASHKLNLVVNDQNSIPEIRNTIGTVKEIIKFFRESILRRKLIPNIPLFCETRWSEKYKCIRLFDNNFIEIKNVLEKLSISSEANTVTRNRAFQLSSATSNSTFLISLKVIAYYSSVLEPVVTKLQGTSVNLHSVHKFVKTELLGILNKHRENSIEYFNTIFEEITEAANSLDFVLKIPRRTNHQSQRSNHNCSSNDSIKDYYRFQRYGLGTQRKLFEISIGTLTKSM